MSVPSQEGRAAKFWLITCALIAAEVVAILETTMSLQLVYAPKGFFDVPLSTLTWMITAYTLAAAIFAAIGARLGDQYGRRRVLIFALSLGAFGSLLSALAPAFWVLVVGRVFQGVTGCVLPLAMGIISARYPKERTGTAVTLVSSSAIIAGAFGILIGGVLLSVFSWHSIYIVTSAIAVAVAFFIAVAVPRDVPEDLAGTRRIDYLGAILFGLGIGAALYAVTTSADLGWGNAQVLIFGIIGIVALAVFARHETCIDYPLFEIRLLRDSKVRASMLLSVILGFGPLGMFSVLSATISRQPDVVAGTNVGVGIGLNPMVFGLWTAVFSGVAFVFAGLIGKMTTDYGARTTLAVGSGLTIIGVLLIAVYPANTVVVLAAILIVTVSSSCLFSGIPAMIVETVDVAVVSTAAAMAQVIRNTFQSVGASVLGVIMSIGAVVVGGQSFVSHPGIWAAGLAIAGSSAVAAVLSLAVGSRTKPRPKLGQYARQAGQPTAAEAAVDGARPELSSETQQP